jgi:hypothetical protein
MAAGEFEDAVERMLLAFEELASTGNRHGGGRPDAGCWATSWVTTSAGCGVSGHDDDLDESKIVSSLGFASGA